MGKMLEALRHADVPAAPLKPLLRSYHPEPEAKAAVETESGEEIPFIEVGGPGTPLEASPLVLPGISGPALLRADRANPRRGPKMPAFAISAAATAEHCPRGVVFRPLAQEKPIGLHSPQVAPELIALHQPDHPLSQQYRLLQSALLAQLPATRPQVLLFTAAAPEGDTTTVLLNVAIASAQQGKPRVAVIDANLNRPAVAQRLGLEPVPGLREVLAGSVPLLRALQVTRQVSLHVLAAGEPGTASDELLSSERIRTVLRQMREGFDLVLVDAPWWDGRPHIIALGSACDAVFLVLPEAKAETPETDSLTKEIPQHGSRLCGCILTL